jgi:hypothetical protein
MRSPSRPSIRISLIALLLSTLTHVGIIHATAWEVINSKLQFLVWPGLATVMLLQDALPESIIARHDPLPHPAILWAALLVNFVAWAALFCLLIAAGRRWAKR